MSPARRLLCGRATASPASSSTPPCPACLTRRRTGLCAFDGLPASHAPSTTENLTAFLAARRDCAVLVEPTQARESCVMKTYARFNRVAPVLLMAALSVGVGCDRTATLGGDSASEQAHAKPLGPQSSPVPPTLDKGWCGGHGVPESVCTRCDDSLIDAFKQAGDWCREHDLPESQCVKCHPGAAARWEAFRTGSADARTPTTPVVGESAGQPADRSGNAVVASAMPRSQRDFSVTCAKAETVIRFDNTRIARDAGLEYTPARTMRLTRTLTRNAEIDYDANRYARLSSRTAGIIVEVRKDLGAPAASGEVLVIVDSAELGASKARLLQAVERHRLAEGDFEREQELAAQKINAARDLYEAESRLAEARIEVTQARQALRNLGMTDLQVDDVLRKSEMSSHLELVAPFEGVLVERSAVIGERVEAGQSILSLADTRRMWARVSLPPDDLRVVKVGLSAVVTVDALRGESFPGRVAWIDTRLDPKTRTVQARIELDNREGLLLALMFGEAQIATRVEEACTMVPREAVQWDGCCNLVFVRMEGEESVFRPRKVRLGHPVEDQYEVLAGLEPGEQVVTKGSFLLKTEILKDSIGAGCCDAVEALPK
ncbi:MAG: efflux RND transporter periplasmic adaptor subunit [Planctomycetota bacterium]|nr:MAG: efflux RND transporter periplasmic adaptor subunit [Planctomycetota bacterium]